MKLDMASSTSEAGFISKQEGKIIMSIELYRG